MKKIKFAKKTTILILSFIAIFLVSAKLFSEDRNLRASGSAETEDEFKSWMLGSRPAESLQLWKTTQEQGNEQYLRKGMHTGNLIETSYLNRGQLSDGYNGANFPLMWPRGSGIEYGYLFAFCVAGEVLSVDGDTLHIVSDCFKRSGIEHSPDGSHWWSWEPLPGYFNDRHLNTREYFIGGITEDVGEDGYTENKR